VVPEHVGEAVDEGVRKAQVVSADANGDELGGRAQAIQVARSAVTGGNGLGVCHAGRVVPRHAKFDC
jgi:hypothetical protein